MSLQDSNEPTRILILSEAFGAGHTQAAHAISSGLQQLCSRVQTQVLELGLHLHPTLAPFIIEAYKKTITAQPHLYGKLYRFHYKKSLNPFSQLALHRICYAQTAATISQLRPHAIVCTHPFPSIVVSRLKKHGLDIPLFTVITDYDAHGAWIGSQVNQYLVSTKDVKFRLLQRGVSPQKIKITGIPLHPSFRQTHDKFEIRQQFQLRDLPTILIMGGGWGLHGSERFRDYVAAWSDRIQFLFCMGNNKKGYAEMADDAVYRHPNVRLLGFCQEIGKLMEVSDLLITKPGGMTCSEGAAKAIPMLFDSPIPGQEEENLQYFTAHGFGEPILSPATIENWLYMLAFRYEEVRIRRESISKKSMPFTTADCVTTIWSLCEKSRT
ncbi:MGDG synthase family glycosyltransferase [Paenibacillus hexagrammi]|uniref:UDP-N-acetylglucosamine--LPS N-acetylglucosamine transferase n=1 Tax=Paenibacillus hexagrammi TaxID=2908839 RepID=A0ABY3SME8_9BACL|nr:glycosyltransferase [Paenibacillus sp. YPD9-1]UJF34371.1 UDP-N-acetylglucosamine--LPS N-acetylglucosamine transferase [Paenibacillus sp. YPD9-1]